jgi:Lipocalin-like domain
MRITTAPFLAALAALAAIVLSVPLHAQQVMTRDQLVGTWQLTTFTATSGNQVSYPLGEHPGGYIGFSPARFWVMLVDSARKATAAAALTDAEAVSLMKTSASYTGRYDVDPTQTPDGMKVVIHVDAASNQTLTGTNRVFFMHVDGDKLTLKSPAVFVPMTGLTSAVQLHFVRTD